MSTSADIHLVTYPKGTPVTTTSEAAEGFTVRRATRADLLDVFRIEQASFPQPWPFAAFERFVGQQGFLVAEPPQSDAADASGGDGFGDGSLGDGSLGDDGLGAVAIVGYVVADTVPNHGRPLGHVKDLAVHPDCRGAGVGSLLLERALGVLRSENASSVKLEVRESNEGALALYRNRGFEQRRTVPRYYEDGEDAVVMVREMD